MESDDPFLIPAPTTAHSSYSASICSGSLSDESASSSKSKQHRKAKRNWSQTLKSFLPSDVTDWKRQHAQRCLHIYYDTEYTTDSIEILKKVKIPSEHLTDEERKYTDFVNEHFTFDRPVNSFKRGLGTAVQKELADIEKHVNDLQKSSELALLPWIFRLKDFLYATTVFCNCLRDLGKNQETLYEGVFKEFASEFARLCHLRVQSCSKAHNVVWENLKGIRVTSEPDLQFFKSGFNHDLYFTSISVTEVKPNVDDIYDPPKKRYKGSSRQSSSSSSRACSSEGSEKPIALDLHDKVLGQHAGELLLDLHAKHKNEDLSGQERNLSMLGMIINGTTVYFTLLQISSKHYEKLKTNDTLSEEDKAIIYYSAGRDILLIKERNSLIEDFLHLNNIEF